jgi:hypothetical protein
MPENAHAGLFAGIDWSRPWLAPFRALAAQILQEPDWRHALNKTATAMDLKNHRGLPVQFVPQSSLPSGTAYEAFISATGSVPTRDNLHDFFNALVWLTFPKIKVQLNALQSVEIERTAKVSTPEHLQSSGRGRLRDAATIFDENATLLIVRDQALIDAFRAHEWHEVFITHREIFFRNCDVWLFGHALMEKLVTPYKAITAHAWPVIADESFFDMMPPERRAWIDTVIALQLRQELDTACYTPVPILGVPGWTEGQDAEYYADKTVFRPKRRGCRRC